MNEPPAGGWARFDDLQGGTAMIFGEPSQVVTAERTDQVAGALAEVEQATRGGRWAFGYVAYEAAAAFDPQMAVREVTPFGMPLVWFGVGDRPTELPVITAPSARSVDDDSDTADWEPEWTPDDHRERVEMIKERIGAGDTYQVNLTERLHAHLGGDPHDLYRRIAIAQRGAHNAYLDLGDWVIASASPELFFDRRGDVVTLRPMKGTSRRGRWTQEDQDLRDALRASPKERAENLMIVDLMRNDISRVAVPGTVSVSRLFDVERYETVWQLTSEISARVRPVTDLVDLFTALFPCGSVTGAPKLRSMSIIDALESGPRGVYSGAVGFVAPPDAPVRARFSVAIRTATVEKPTGQAIYGTGGGITWSSDAAAERAEALLKAVVLSAEPREVSIFETMRFEPGSGLRNGERHLQRLMESAAYLGFDVQLDAVRACLADRLSSARCSRVRLAVTRDGAVSVDLHPVPAALGRPVRVALDLDPVDPGDWRLYHKISWRSPYEVRAKRHPEADDVIMVNTRGELTETTRATVAVRLGGRWCTPPVTSGCLPGVERARLIGEGELEERVIRIADLASAEGVAVLNSLRGWLPAELGARTSSSG